MEILSAPVLLADPLTNTVVGEMSRVRQISSPHDVATLADGQIILVTLDDYTLDQTRYVDAYLFGTDGRKSDSAALRLDDVSSYDQAIRAQVRLDDPSVAALPDGGFVAAWIGWGGPYGTGSIVLRTFDGPARQPTGPEVLTPVVPDASETRLLVLADGTVVFAWQGSAPAGGAGSGVYYRIFASDGTPLGDAHFLSGPEAVAGAVRADLHDIRFPPDGGAGFMLEWSVRDDAGAQTVLSTRVADPAVPPVADDTVMVAVPWTGTPEYFELADGRELQSFGATLRLLDAQDIDISPGPFDGSPDTLTTSFVSHGEGWSELVFFQNVPTDMAYASLTDGRVLSVGETVNGKFVYQANLFNRPIDPGGGIVGTPALDLTLEVVFSDPDFEGFDANATYRWLSGGTVVGSNRTLTLTDALATRLEGRTLSVEVLYRGSAKMDYDIVRFGPTAPVSTDYPILTGTAADEVIRGSLQRDVIDGLGGNDTITGLDGNDTMTGGDGDDVMDGGPGTDTMTGGAGDDVMIGGTGDDTLDGGAGADLIRGGGGNDLIHAGPSDGRAGDTVFGESGNDTIYGSDGADSLNGQHDDDIIYGGVTENDLADTISGGVGDDWIDAGYGNDLCYGSWGDDTILGGFGADTLVGQVGDDLISGGALSDLIFGGDGNDFLNGGFGSDRLNGGAGADRFFHLGVADHGSDWIQDYDAAAGAVLLFGGVATRAQFQVNTAETANAGTAGVDEAFVIHRPTGQILWALVDGGAQGAINIQIGGQVFDLLV